MPPRAPPPLYTPPPTSPFSVYVGGAQNGDVVMKSAADYLDKGSELLAGKKDMTDEKKVIGYYLFQSLRHAKQNPILILRHFVPKTWL